MVFCERTEHKFCWILSTPVHSTEVSFISDFSKNGCLLRSTDKTDNSQQWSGQHYTRLFLLFNNNNLLVDCANCGANYFLSPTPALPSASSLLVARHYDLALVADRFLTALFYEATNSSYLFGIYRDRWHISSVIYLAIATLSILEPKSI